MNSCIDTDEAVTLSEIFGESALERVRHIGACDLCAHELEQTLAITASLRQTESAASMTAGAMAGIRASRTSSQSSNLLTGLIFAVASATALVALVAATGTSSTIMSPLGLLAPLATGIFAAVSSRKGEHAAP
jgi:anti-sigma factor RsiW